MFGQTLAADKVQFSNLLLGCQIAQMAPIRKYKDFVFSACSGKTQTFCSGPESISVGSRRLQMKTKVTASIATLLFCWFQGKSRHPRSRSVFELFSLPSFSFFLSVCLASYGFHPMGGVNAPFDKSQPTRSKAYIT
jgi:hypothetical protein